MAAGFHHPPLPPHQSPPAPLPSASVFPAEGNTKMIFSSSSSSSYSAAPFVDEQLRHRSFPLAPSSHLRPVPLLPPSELVLNTFKGCPPPSSPPCFLDLPPVQTVPWPTPLLIFFLRSAAAPPSLLLLLPPPPPHLFLPPPLLLFPSSIFLLLPPSFLLPSNCPVSRPQFIWPEEMDISSKGIRVSQSVSVRVVRFCPLSGIVRQCPSVGLVPTSFLLTLAQIPQQSGTFTNRRDH